MPVDGIYSDSVRSDNIHFLISPADRAKAEAAYTRRIIRKSDFTRAERDVLVAVVNLWFYHRNGKKGFIHPGRSNLAKKSKTSIPTVARALALFRDLDFMEPKDYAKGGTGCATHYLVSLRTIWDYLDPDNVEMMPGELKKIGRQTVSKAPHHDPVYDTVSAYQNDTLSKESAQTCSNRFDASFGPSISDAEDGA